MPRDSEHERGHLPPDAGLPSRPAPDSTPAALDRRSALKLMGAAAALAAGAAGCARKPVRRILSRVETPEYMHPGEPIYYSSIWTEAGLPYGLLVRTLDGRPVAVEGDPGHPVNQGAAAAAMKAAILGLYDPERLRAPRRGEREIAWEEADREILAALRRARRAALLTRAGLGPAERTLVARFLQACPAARHFPWEAVHDGPRRLTWRRLFGADGELRPLLGEARVILSLEADFLGTDGAVLEATRRFAAGRAPEEAVGGGPSRLYAAEGAVTLTGMNADHRFPIRSTALGALAAALRRAVAGEAAPLAELAGRHRLPPAALAALARDLAANRGLALVLAGPHLPAAVHAEVCLLNEALRAFGKTLAWNPSPPALPAADPAELAAFLAGGVDVLLCLGVNPVYDWPGGGFAALLARAGLAVGHGLHRDETVGACALSLPSSHNLESWGDGSFRPGSRGLCQPVIAPLHRSRQEAESLLLWTKGLAPADPELQACRDWHDFLKARWQRELLAGEADPERAWEEALRTGGRHREELPQPPPPLDRAEAERLAAAPPPGETGLELLLLPHPALLDGRFAANGWLQELPDPVSRLVWDAGAAAMAPATAAELGLAEGDLAEIDTGEARARLPVLLQPGMAPGVVAATLGGGRTRAGAVGTGRGFAAAALQAPATAAESGRLRGGVRLARAGGRYPLVRTQKHFDMQGRPIVLAATAADLVRDPQAIRKRRHLPPDTQLHGADDYSQGPKWAMAVDLARCTGCGACVTACQAENNVPIVGKEECARGREMQWLRIDLYLAGDPANPAFLAQPMLCQHCDNAPCEPVCPVQATSHSPEGLNEMTYNRCVGTRYCANNCPYKVRRYNFYNYQKRILKDPLQELLFNPSVTVRTVGVMEKCTFCVQRLNEARFRQKAAGRFRPPDRSILTACQQACPAGAIAFGDATDGQSRVAAWSRGPRAYFVLEELNVRPNVAYLARVANPHPDLAGPPPAGHGGER